MVICVYNIIVEQQEFWRCIMKKFVNSVEPRAIAASGVDAAAVAQAKLSTDKDITQR